MKQQQMPPVQVEPGIIWMAADHDLLCTIPLDQKDGATEAHIRDRLHETVSLRFSAIDFDTLDGFVTACEERPLGIFEDDEHGLQFGVVIRPYKAPETA